MIISGISYFLFFSDFFEIEKIIVLRQAQDNSERVIIGQVKVSEEDIKSLVPQKNIFLIDIEEIKKDILAKFIKIDSVQVQRSFPDALSILVKERSPLAAWCEQDSCFLVDKGGVIFEEVSTTADLIKIAGAKEMLNKEKIAQILDIQHKLKDGPGITTTQAFIASEQRLNIKTSEAWEIYFNTEGDLNWQLQELGLVLEKQITPEKRSNLEYIDLRFSRVYYKPR